MTKRLASLAVCAAAAVTFVLPAAPASATCISFEHTPVECAKEALGGVVSDGCVWYGTFKVACLTGS